MKIAYFKYWIEIDGHRYRCSINQFLTGFTGVKDTAFRRSFMCAQGTTLLFPTRAGMYAFVVTKDHELIKAVGANTLTMQDIDTRLKAGEHIAFAAYVLVEQDYFAVVTTLHGPRARRFSDFINQVLNAVGLHEVCFACKPLYSQVDVSTARKFAFKGGIRIHTKPSSSLFRTVAPWLNDPEDAAKLIVEIRPERGRPMAKTFDAVLDHAKEPGIDRMVVSAKEELADQLTDYYIVGSGAISGRADSRDEESIMSDLQADAQSNPALREAIEEYRRDNAYEKRDLSELRRFTAAAAWSPAVARRASAAISL